MEEAGHGDYVRIDDPELGEMEELVRAAIAWRVAPTYNRDNEEDELLRCIDNIRLTRGIF
jgi:hypothetical protein